MSNKKYIAAAMASLVILTCSAICVYFTATPGYIVTPDARTENQFSDIYIEHCPVALYASAARDSINDAGSGETGSGALVFGGARDEHVLQDTPTTSAELKPYCDLGFSEWTVDDVGRTCQIYTPEPDWYSAPERIKPDFEISEAQLFDMEQKNLVIYSKSPYTVSDEKGRKWTPPSEKKSYKLRVEWTLTVEQE